MLRRALFIAAKEVKFFFRDRETYIWAFVMPVVFMYFIGTVTSQSGGGAGMRPRTGLPWPCRPVPASSPINWCSAWSRTGWPSIARIRPASWATPRAADPPGEVHGLALRGEKTVVKLQRKDEGFANDFDQFRVARAVYTVLADLAVCTATGGSPDAAAFERLHKMPRGHAGSRAGGAAQAVPHGLRAGGAGHHDHVYDAVALVSGLRVAGG